MEIHDGFGLRKEIHDWLKANAGRRANSQNDLIWTSAGYRYEVTQSRGNPLYMSSRFDGSSRTDSPAFLHFFFKSPAVATLFKLTWGGI